MCEAANVGNLETHILGQLATNREVQSVCIRRLDSVVQSQLDRQACAGRRIRKWEAPGGSGGKYCAPVASSCGRVLRPVRRGAVSTLGMGAFIPVESPKDPRLSKVFIKPAPIRSNTTPKPPRMTVFSPLPKRLFNQPSSAWGE